METSGTCFLARLPVPFLQALGRRPILRLLFILAWLTVIVMISPNDSAFGDEPPAASEAPRVRELDRLIESLVNRNQSPKIIDKGSQSFPLFDENYDWDEKRRVVKALFELVERDGNELWPRLVEHAGDKRYAVTYDYDGYAFNVTVGWLCEQIAKGDLLFAYWQHTPQVKGTERAGQHRAAWAPDEELSDGIQAWYRKRPGKPLYELQIEVCQWAIAKAPGLKLVSEQERKLFVEKVTREIERLKETRKPAINKSRFRGESYGWFSAEKAKKIREKYEKEKDTDSPKK